MVNLKAKPYYLTDEDIKWVEDTISNMTDEEKVGQLFFQLTAGMDEAYLKELMEKYHLGGCRYNNMPAAAVQQQNRILQKQAEEAAANADPEIDALVAARTQAKKEKNFAEADRIRDKLKARGIEIIDTPQGTKWRKV